MADQDEIGTLHVRSAESERRKRAAAIEVRIEQDHLTIVGELEVRETGPADRECRRLERKWTAGRDELARTAARIGGLRGRKRPRIENRGLRARTKQEHAGQCRQQCRFQLTAPPRCLVALDDDRDLCLARIAERASVNRTGAPGAIEALLRSTEPATLSSAQKPGSVPDCHAFG